MYSSSPHTALDIMFDTNKTDLSKYKESIGCLIKYTLNGKAMF